MTSRKPRIIPRTASCRRCGVPVTAGTKTGLCRPCKNAYVFGDPELRQKRIEAVRAKWQDPEFLAMKQRECAQMGRDNGTDPLRRAKCAERGRATAHRILTKEVRDKIRAKQHIITAKLEEHRLGWCPPEYRDEYRYLTATKRLTSAQARKAVTDLMRKDRERELARLTPFERQMRALENGAKLVEVAPRATLDRPGVYRS